MIINLFLKMILICISFHNLHAKIPSYTWKNSKRKMFEQWHTCTYDTVMSISPLKLLNVINFLQNRREATHPSIQTIYIYIYNLPFIPLRQSIWVQPSALFQGLLHLIKWLYMEPCFAPFQLLSSWGRWHRKVGRQTDV